MPASPPATPTPTSLHEAALRHLSRYATTRAGLLRVLDRRLQRWAALTQPDVGEAAALRQAARDIVDGLLAQGLVSDSAFADMRARRLTRAGHSRRAVAAHLAARGVEADTVRASVPEDLELAAALATARRRRIGPFRMTPADADGRRKELAVLARAGFTREIATTALSMDLAQAEAIVLQLRRE